MVEIGWKSKNMDDLGPENKFPCQSIRKTQDCWKVMYLKAAC